jgi:hypothetical protein
MENTQSVYIETTNETWEMQDDLALKLAEYKKEHPEEDENTDALHLAWFATLSADEQAKIQKHTPQP